ncbi:MAG: hypothetical protein AAGF99_06635 [Bacteroidota bacterium]
MITRLALCCMLLAVSTSVAAQPVPDATAQRPVGAALAPSVRFVELAGTRVQQGGELAWTLTFDEANGPGEVQVGPTAPAPGGEVCTLSNETLTATTSGPVLTRTGPDGTVRWRHTLLADGQALGAFYSVVAAGDACVAALRPSSLPRSRFLIVRANGDGVAWSREIDAGASDAFSRAVGVAADEAGNVWLATQPRQEPGTQPETLIVRLDASGTQTTSVTYGGGDEDVSFAGLALLPDGRAAISYYANSLGDSVFLIVDPDGDLTLVEPGLFLFPSALAIRGDEVVVAGSDLAGVRRVKLARFALDGTVRWATSLPTGFSSDPLTVRLALGTEAAYMAWGSERVVGVPTRVSRLRLDNGAEEWQQAIPTEDFRVIAGLLADASGVVIWSSSLSFGPSVLTAFDTEGEVRWTFSDVGVRSGGFGRPALVPCAEGAACLVAQRFDVLPANASDTWTIDAFDASEEPRWTQTRVGAPTAQYELHGTALAPEGGSYVFGTTRTEEGGRDLIVARVTPGGAIEWASAIDGGSTDDSPQAFGFGIKPSGSLSVSATGDVLVSGTAVDVGDDGERRARALVARLAPDGTARWVRRLDLAPESTNQFAGSVVDDAAGGAAFPVLVDDLAALTVEIVRLDPNGETGWTALVTDAEPYPLDFHRTPNGYALASLAFPPIATRVYRFSETGTFESTTSTASRPECGEVGGEFDATAGADASGTIHVAGRSIGGDEPCRGPAVFRFRPDGTVEFTRVGTISAEIAEILVRDDGTTLVGYNDFDDEGRLLRIAPDGTVLWDESVTVEVRGVALGLGVGALAVGPARDDAAPLATAYVPDVGASVVPLDNLGGLATTPRTALVADDGTGYVGLDAEAFGIGLVGLARIDNALPVAASQDELQPAAPLLARLGPNPLRTGAPLRLLLGAPADLALYDLLGRRVAAWDAVPPGDFETALPARLAAGLYMLRAEGKDTAATLRVTVLR